MEDVVKSKLLKCKCKHEYQDKKYNGKRVCNPTAKPGVYRCTVCCALITDPHHKYTEKFTKAKKIQH